IDLALELISVHSTTAFLFYYTATTDIYTLSLHDALPISNLSAEEIEEGFADFINNLKWTIIENRIVTANNLEVKYDEVVDLAKRSEEHTSELQSRENLVCRLLLEKKNNRKIRYSSQSRTQ